MKLQCKGQVLQAGQYDNSQHTGHSMYMDDCKKLCNIISYSVAIRTGPYTEVYNLLFIRDQVSS